MSSRTGYRDADLIIIDGRNTLFRASYANATLGFKSEDGWQPTGGVYGFIESVLSVAGNARDARIVVAWEGGKDHRRDVVDTYKVRKPDPRQEALVATVLKQEAILKGLLKKTDWDSARSPEWEADDAMGVLAMAGWRLGLRVVMYSTDADMLQLLRDDENGSWVRQIKPTKGVNVVWTAQSVRDHPDWGVDPEKVIDVKALSGDSSDCYKGCPGIGQKWATKIIAAHNNLDQVFEDAEKTGSICGSEKKAQTILENEDYIRDCYEVATINTRAKTIYTEGSPDRVALKNALTTLRFHSLRGERSIRRMLS